MRKFPNYQEYIELPEYLNLVALLEKGIGIHHSGVMPPLREMVELLYSRGRIKLLFCTETLSVGINMPVKTAIFTDVNKFDGNINRILYSHEYTQAAGRAGRLGLDKVGHVIHLNNLFRNVDSVNYKKMMNNKPPVLKSKFKISFNLLLSLIDIGKNNFSEFAEKSMIKDVITNELGEIYKDISKLSIEKENAYRVISTIKSCHQVCNDYINLLEKRKNAVNKKRKDIERDIQSIKDMYPSIDNDVILMEKYNSKCDELENKNCEYEKLNSIISFEINSILEFLSREKFIDKIDENEKYILTPKGQLANQLKEIHCLAFSELVELGDLTKLSVTELIQLFSCFTNIVVSDEDKDFKIDGDKVKIEEIMYKMTNLYNYYMNFEAKNNINTGIEYGIHYDLINYVEEWVKCENIGECKFVLEKAEKEKKIFLGEFVKAILKINNISSEFEKIAEFIGNVEFLSKLKEIPHKTLKYVVTNQSLYV